MGKGILAVIAAILLLGWLFSGPSTGGKESQTAAPKAVAAPGGAGRNQPSTVTPAEPPTPELTDAQRAAIYAGMAKQVDKIENITWYRDKATPGVPLRTIAYLYMGEQNGSSWLRLKVQYWANTWLFVDRALIVVDGEKRGELSGPWKRDNGSGSIWEWLDLAVNGQNSGVVKAMAGAKAVTIRFYGDRGYIDHKMSAADLKALSNMVKAYEALGGTY